VRYQRGFSLVELLVALSIITLLVAVLLPALSAARSLARRMGCASNVRQVTQAMHVYATENEGYWPYAVRTGSGQSDPISFDEALRPYLGRDVPPQSQMKASNGLPSASGHPVFVCPSDPTRGQWQPDFANRSYAMTGDTARMRKPSTNLPPEWSEVEPQFQRDAYPSAAPSQTLVLSELSYKPNAAGSDGNRQGAMATSKVYGANEHHPVYQPTSIIPLSGNSSALGTADVKPLHGTRNKPVCNYAFLDGHVSAYRPEETIGPGGDIAGGASGSQGFWTLGPND